MDRCLNYSELCRMMTGHEWDFFTACCEVRKQGIYCLDFALEELDLDKLLILRENYLAVNAISCRLDFRGDASGRVADLLKMAYLAGAEKVIPSVPEEDAPETAAVNAAGLFRLQHALKELGVDLVMP